MDKIVSISQIKEITSSNSPDSGYRIIYPKADGWYDKDSTGTETKIGDVSGTENYLSKYGSSGLSDSIIVDDGTNIGIGVGTPEAKLDVNGTIYSRTGGIYTDIINSYSSSLQIGGTPLTFFVNGSEVARLSDTSRLGLGLTVPTARLHVLSEGITSSTYVAKLHNLDSTTSFNLRDDGYLDFLSSRTAGQSSFQIRSAATGIAFQVQAHYGRIFMGTNVPTAPTLAPHTLNIGTYGIGGYIGFGNDAAKGSITEYGGTGILFRGYESVGSTTEFMLNSDAGYYASNNNTTAAFLKNVAIGAYAVPNTGTRLLVKGSGNTSSTKALKITNSDDTTSLEVFDNGTFQFTGVAPLESSSNLFSFSVPLGAAAAWYSGLALNFVNSEPNAYTKGLYIQATGSNSYAAHIANNTSGCAALLGTPSFGVQSNGPLFVNGAESQLKGIGSTSGTYSLRVRNSADAYSLQCANDGSVYNNGKGEFISNTAFGSGAGVSWITNGYNNAAFGYYALNATTSGAENVAVGCNSMRYNTTGFENTAVGSSSLGTNTTGQYNTAVGSGSLLLNTTGTANNAFGKLSLNSNTTGSQNIAIGYRALVSNTTGSYNLALGGDATLFTNNGDYNVGLGYYAGQANNGARNIFLGSYAGSFQTATSDLFIVDNRTRGNAANDLAQAIIVGTMDASPSNQILVVNAKLKAAMITTKPGSITDEIPVGGAFLEFLTAGTSTGSTDTVLNTTSGVRSTANYLVRAGDKFKGMFSGYFTGSTTPTKRIKLIYGGVTIFDSGALTTTHDNNWRLEFTLVTTNGSNVISEVSFTTHDVIGGTSLTQLYTDNNTFTLTNDIVIQVKGQSSGVGAADGDVVSRLGYIEYQPGKV